MSDSTQTNEAETQRIENDSQLFVIIRDGLILIALSSLFVWGLNAIFSNFKPKENKTENIVALIIQEKKLDEIKKEIEETLNTLSIKEKLSKGEVQHEFFNDPDNHGRTVLMMASYANFNDLNKRNAKDQYRLPIIQLLLSYDQKSIHDKDKDGWTALSWAAWSGLPLVTGELLNQGADINTQDRNGNTPLMIAAQVGRTNVVQVLIDKGADKTLRNADGMTAEEIADAVASGLSDELAMPYLDIISIIGGEKTPDNV